MLSLSRHVPSKMWCPGLVPWSGTHPSSLVFVVVPRGPCLPLLARAAAAIVNPRTRPSHMTEIPLLLGS